MGLFLGYFFGVTFREFGEKDKFKISRCLILSFKLIEYPLCETDACYKVEMGVEYNNSILKENITTVTYCNSKKNSTPSKTHLSHQKLDKSNAYETKYEANQYTLDHPVGSIITCFFNKQNEKKVVLNFKNNVGAIVAEAIAAFLIIFAIVLFCAKVALLPKQIDSLLIFFLLFFSFVT